MEDFTAQFILAWFGIFLIYWIVAAFSTKRTLEKQSPWQRILFLGVLLAVYMSLRRGGALSAYSGVILWPRSLASGVAGDVIALAGLTTMLWARVVLGGNWSSSVVFKEGHELIDRGPYHYVRHPIYSGLLTMILGTAVLYGRLGGFIALFVLFLAFWFKSRQEERLMTKHFPEAYPSYKGRVKALIPRVFQNGFRSAVLKF
jgi:protein-S-isoprenylcysteine O-methyltransferase Ste14